jgi:hypothetical protein
MWARKSFGSKVICFFPSAIGLSPCPGFVVGATKLCALIHLDRMPAQILVKLATQKSAATQTGAIGAHKFSL